MATIAELGTRIFNTSSGTKTVTATPAVGDLIVLVCAHTGNTTTTTPTDNNADGLGTYSLITSALKATSADKLAIYVRNKPIGSATSTVFTHAAGTSTGGGVAVFKLTGISKQSTYAALQSAVVNNQSAGTPTVTMGAAINTGNPCLGVVFNATSPAGMTARASWSESNDVGYSTPTTGMECMVRASGETGSSIAWGSSSASAYCAIVVEFDTSTSPLDIVQSGNIGLTPTLSVSGNLQASWELIQSGSIAMAGAFAITGDLGYAVPIVRFDLARAFSIPLSASLSVSGDVAAGPPTSFSDTFSVAQNPIASPWVKNCTACQNVVVTGGIATNDHTNSNNDDAYAWVSRAAFSAPNDNYEAIVTLAEPGPDQMETEVLVRVEDTSSGYYGYEVLYNNGGGELVRIEGAPGIVGGFTEFPSTAYTVAGGGVAGDRIKVRVTGTNPVRIQMWFEHASNPGVWTQYIDYSDSDAVRRTTGQPAIGFYTSASGGSAPGSKGWSDFSVVAV